MRIDLIVSRHPAAIEFIRQELGGEIPATSSATIDDVRGKIVAGNLPLYLASHARRIVAIEFNGDPPRGQEYGPEEMREAEATLRGYIVVPYSELF